MIRRIKGTYDILPEEAEKWQKIEDVMRKVARIFNFKEIRTPIFEASELFHRSVGESSDIVKKETYDFEDRGKRSNTLRPEGTAPIARAVIENKLYADPAQPQKLYYFGPMFRYERPQKGRQRQFHQFGAEIIGSASPLVDVEIINFALTYLKALGIDDVIVKVNSLGDKASKENYIKVLREYLEPNINELCQDCQRRHEENPLRVLDCKVDQKNPILLNAPKPVDYLTDEARYHFDHVVQGLESLQLDFEIDGNLVRGLDYYTHTVFEIQSQSDSLGSQSTLVGGGRYNHLIEELDGPDTPAVGFAFGAERLLLALENSPVLESKSEIHAYFISLDNIFTNEGLKIINDLRMGGILIDYDFLNRSLKAQFKQADRLNAKFYLIYGEKEAKEGIINVKDSETGEQVPVKIDDLYDYLLKQLKGGSCSNGCSGC
ncbi:MAG: histidine--tRNA ligase [Tenericutes bacterium]|jgi:histidyl-tRNA synthetase|nr:histidine--tRNA ligase [Mycoplasmatota bacterium]